MSTTEQQFDVIADYAGVEGDANYIAVMKGDVVRLIKKDKQWLTVEKDGHIGKVPKEVIQKDLSKYQLDKLHQILKDIHCIIDSNTIIDEEKEMKLKEILNELKKKENHKLRKIFNTESFKLIRLYINNCKTRIQKILLEIIELVAEKGIQMYQKNDPMYQKNDPMFDDIKNSKLIKQIKKIIKYYVRKQEEEMKFSTETEQLVRIYVQIMKGRESDQLMIGIYIKMIEKNINKLINIFNNLQQKDDNKNNNQIDDEEIESELKQSSQLIKIISLIREKDPKSKYETKIPDQIIKILKQKVYQLIHINCSPNINCQQCINVPQSPALQELKSDVFQSFYEVSWVNSQFKTMLMDDHNIILHLTHPLIQFASQSQFKKKTNSIQQHNQQQSESSSSISLITSSLKLLWSLIYIDNVCKTVIKTPNAINSLSMLTSYKLNTHFNQKYDSQSQEIRNRSRECLSQIQYKGDAKVQSNLVNIGNGRVMSIVISTAGGIGEEQDKEILDVLMHIQWVFKALPKGSNDYPSFQPLPLLARRTEEQIEEEGANEELEAQMKKNKYGSYIMIWANKAKAAILNHFIHWSNIGPN